MDIRSVAGNARVYGITATIIGGLWAHAYAVSRLEPERRSWPAQVQLTPLTEAAGGSELPEECADVGE